MGEYDSGPRPLPFELRYPLIQITTVEDDGDYPPSSFVWPDDPDERVIVPFYLSLNEYNVLASSIDVGSDIAYAEDAQRVIWLWLRNMRIEVPMCAAIASAILTCGDVQAALNVWFINALNTDEVFAYEFSQWIMENSIAEDAIGDLVPRLGLASTASQANIIAGGPCDGDVLYAQAVGIVDTLDGLSRQFLNAVSTGVDPLSYAQAVLTLVPFVGGFFQSVFVTQFAVQIATAINLVYVNNWDALNKTDLYCDLYCLIDEECSITLDQIVQFYNDRSGFGLDESPYESFRSIFDVIANGGLAGDNVVYAMHLLILACIRMGVGVFGVDYGQYALSIVAAGGTPNPDYALCDPCIPPVEDCNDLTVNAFGWYPSNASGVPAPDAWGNWIAGQGLAPYTYFGSIHQFYFTKTPTMGVVNRVTFQFNEAVTNFRIGTQGGTSYYYDGTPSTSVTFENASHPGFALDLENPIYITFSDTLAPTSSFRVQEVCYQFEE